jgi:penicillin-binding protein 2
MGRLGFLQLVKCAQYRQEIEDARILPPIQLPTVRGSILDRNGNAIATDKPVFYVQTNYMMTRLLDDRFWEAEIQQMLQANKEFTRDQAESEVHEKFTDQLAEILVIIERCSQFDHVTPFDIEDTIRNINDRVWMKRKFFAWDRAFPYSEVRARAKAEKKYVRLSHAIAEFDAESDPQEQLLMITKIRVPEMFANQPILRLTTDSDLLDAQRMFADIEAVEILPVAKRVYPYKTVASQIIGWVGPARSQDRKLFIDDDLSKYREDEVAGKDGIERLCEVILRGRRGKVVYDRDGNKLEELGAPTQFGEDVTLSIDADLQDDIEKYLARSITDPNSDDGIAAVVLDVVTGDILALVSVPTYDLNTVRTEYNNIRSDPKKPMANRAIYETYPPGSTIKPVLLAMGLQEGKVSASEIISCPYERAPRRWPNCLQYSRFHSCHDYRWANEGGNIGRNAIRGSCNIYFSRLADRMPSDQLQKWLYSFGYGQKILPGPTLDEQLIRLDRHQDTQFNIRQSAGWISTGAPRGGKKTLEEMPKIEVFAKRMFGIGQSDFRATVLQIANATAVIARNGIYKAPRLFIEENNESPTHDLGVTPYIISVVKDGMHAVVMERSGTANTAFKGSPLHERGVKLYGKTGSTESPFNALFTGFVEDDTARSIAIAIIVEGGQSGSGDAAPLAEHILTLCNEAGYIGIAPEKEKPKPLNENGKRILTAPPEVLIPN